MANVAGDVLAPSIPGVQARELLEDISTWGCVTTIIFSGGSVFEFKGEFPRGELGSGFYNFGHAVVRGFQGHLNLDRIASIGFQDGKHRGRQSYAFVFKDQDDSCIFKIFLGRDEHGKLFDSQVEAFKQKYEQARVQGTIEGAGDA
jgi:putative heme utilization carrier protein HutX